MADPERQWLIKSIQDILIPAFVARGFFQLPLAGEDARSSEIRTAFPFGRLRRPRNGGFVQVEIQLDKHKRPAFRINFGFVPSEGIKHAVGPVKLEDAWVQYLDEYYELYQNRWTKRWFAVSDARADAAAYQSLAEAAVTLLPEVDAVFDSHKSLPFFSHVRHVRA